MPREHPFSQVIVFMYLQPEVPEMIQKALIFNCFSARGQNKEGGLRSGLGDQLSGTETYTVMRRVGVTMLVASIFSDQLEEDE